MYWVFADSQHLAEVIVSQILPAEIVYSDVNFARSPAGEVWIEPAASIPRALARELKERGVRSRRKKSPALKLQTVEAWWQILPPCRLPGNGETDGEQSVILEIPAGEEVSRTLQEIRRLGGRLESIHFPWEPCEPVHLRMRELPYFSWLAASDPTRSQSQRLFVFRAPQVAIEAGYSHPLVDFIDVPGDHILLLDGHGEVQMLGPVRMRTLTDPSRLPVPSNESSIFASEPVDRIPVSIRFLARPSPELPSLWVIPLAELQAWAKGAEQRLLEQLAVAIIDPFDSPRVVIRPLDETAPPVLLWDSAGFFPSRAVPGLYLPWNRDLHPAAARSEVMHSVLNCSRDCVTWISEESANPLCVQSVSRSAFRPLREWVDYELPYSAGQFEPWSPHWPRGFEPFQILEEPRTRSDKPQRDPIPREERNAPSQRTARARRSPSQKPAEPQVSRPVARNHREARQRLAELQKNFLADGLAWDADDHRASWREMANLHFLLRQSDEGMLCLSHALWKGPLPEAAWFQSVWKTWPGKERDDSPSRVLANLIRTEKPTGEELSRLAFLLIWFSTEEFTEPFPSDRIAELQEFLMRFESELPVRVGWLAWVSFLRTLGGDALTLARARDRFLERLFARGIRRERDLPKFLQSGRLGSGPGLLGGSLRLSDFREVLHAWSRANSKNAINETRTYLDLVLAFGMARRGEIRSAKQLLESASNLLRRTRDKLHRWCLEAFEYRIRQVLSGDHPTLPLPRPLVNAFEAFSKHDQFKLNRLRQDSQILEPPQSRDLYAAYRQDSAGDLARELTELAGIEDSIELAGRYEWLWQTHRPFEARYRLAVTGLDLAPRMGATTAERLLEQAAHLRTQDCNAYQRLELLERSLRVAAHYDRAEWIAHCVSDLSRFLDSLRDAETETVFSVESLVGDSFQGMRRFGVRAEMIHLLDQMEAWAKASLAEGLKPQLLSLQIAGGRFFFEQNELAWPLLDRVRDMLHAEKLSALAQTQLARAYLKALEFAPAESADERFWDFFQNVRGISDAFSVNSLVFVSQLSVAEAFVFARTGEVNQQEPAIRRWLDDEEYCVRRRIHHDLHATLHMV